MALLTVNNFALIEGELRLPRVGVWSADLKVDTTNTVGIGGAVTIASADGKFSYSGVAYREGVYTNTLTMRVIGGNGGLAPPPAGVGQLLTPKFYQNVTLELVLTDILTACGERLASSSDPSVLSIFLPKWTRTAVSGKRALQALFRTIATSWRTLPDGSFWVGTDSYPQAPATKFDLLERHFGEGRVTIASEQPFVTPGTLLPITIDGVTLNESVSNVVHHVRGEQIRSEVWFERSGVES